MLPVIEPLSSARSLESFCFPQKTVGLCPVQGQEYPETEIL